ncbi:MAG: translation initiation factor IF-6 [Desulfurococcales archaeon]|nr:translation initiation factor IF-6 [Desulfurococcales archaeon]
MSNSFRVEYFDYKGNPNVGVYIVANNKLALIPMDINPKDAEIIQDVLGVEVFQVKISETSLLGVLVALNDNGIIIPRTSSDSEIRKLKGIVKTMGLELGVLPSRNNAVGNMVLANNKAALVYPELDDDSVRVIKDVLDVEVTRKSIIGIPTVGSLGVITDRGGIVHRDVAEDELDWLSEYFKVNIITGTVNFGVSFIKTGLVANSKGGLVGSETMGPELVRIQMALGG